MGELVRAPCPHPGSLMGAGRAGQERQVSCGLGLGLWGSQARARRSGRTGPFAATAACQTSHSQPPRHELPPHPRPAPAPVPTCVSNLTKLPSSTTRRKGRTGLVQPGSPGHPRPSSKWARCRPCKGRWQDTITALLPQPHPLTGMTEFP